MRKTGAGSAREEKGCKDRQVMLRKGLDEELSSHRVRRRCLWAAEVPGVWLPEVLEVPYPDCAGFARVFQHGDDADLS